MSGSVLEWCSDRSKSKYESYASNPFNITIINPKGPRWGSYRIMRGAKKKTFTRSLVRLDFPFYGSYTNVGFRLAISIPGNYVDIETMLEKGTDKSIRDSDSVRPDELAVNYSDNNKTGDSGNEYELKKIKNDEVIIDNVTGLMWHPSGSDKNMTWVLAKQWVDDLNQRGYAGFHDWRLPTVKEADFLLESRKNKATLYLLTIFFDRNRDCIWTGNSCGADGAWYLDIKNGRLKYTYADIEESKYWKYVHPVRTDKSTTRMQKRCRNKTMMIFTLPMNQGVELKAEELRVVGGRMIWFG